MMNININIDLLDQEIIKNKKRKNHNKCKKIGKTPNNNDSILQEFNFFSQNSIKIQNKIKEIPFYTTMFDCFSKYSFVDFNELNNDKNNEPIENNEPIKKYDLNKKYIIVKYLKKDIPILYFNNYFLLDNLESPKNKNIFIKKLLETYDDLLKSLIQLNNKSICYFNLNSTENIYFNEKMELIIEGKSFEKSIDYDYSNKNFCLDIIKIVEELLIITHENIHSFPPEVFIIHYLIKKDVFSLSFSIIQEICNEMEKIYFHFHDEKKIYQNISKDISTLLSPWINKPKEEVIKFLSKFIYTWDNYCLSLLYIKMIHNIIKNLNYDTKYTFLSKWIILLKKNISINPLKRESLENTLEEYLCILD